MIRVGPAGWAYKDWAGIVYPSPRPRGFQPPAYLARYFNTIEINVSFYRPLAPKTSEDWTKAIESNAEFRFTAKLWRGFTHERTASEHDQMEFKEGIAPLLDAGRLGALLLQFPWSFRNEPGNVDYLRRLADRFEEYPLVLEVRHSSWNDPEILDLLNGLRIGLCNIDQPLFKRSIAPSALTTSPIGYIRLHGRNYKSWWTENSHPGERYDYLYSPQDLDPWIDRIHAVANAAQDTYVVTNNHYLGKAVVNATEISSLVKGEPIPAPEPLVQHYPELIPFTCSPAQRTLHF
jgi:uncharacterized protein YecE (DUF72 family)